MSHHHDDEDGDGISRRHALECMLWAGTGVLWAVSGGVPKSLGLLEPAAAATAAATGFTFLQISDSHVGFDKAANPHALDTLKEAIGRVNALPAKPAFMLHTGDITHLSKAEQFDTADQIIGGAGLDVHYVPGEHDIVDEGTGKAYLERYGKNTKGSGWYSFDQNGVHFIGLVNVANLKAGGLGYLGPEQLEWLEDDLKPLSASTPIVVFAHIPLWSVYPTWGWGRTRLGAGAHISQALRLGHGAQRPHPPADAEGRGQRHLPHGALDRISAAGAGHCPLTRTDGRSGRKAAQRPRHHHRHFQARQVGAGDHRYGARRRLNLTSFQPR